MLLFCLHFAVAAEPVVSGISPANPAVVAPTEWSELLITELVAMPSAAARKARLSAELGATTDAERASTLGQAIAVVSQLDSHQRVDPSIVRLFLRVALSPDASVRAAAVTAAAANGDPPQPTALLAVLAPPAASPGVFAPQTVADPEKLRMYKQKHLVRGTLQFTGGGGAYYRPGYGGLPGTYGANPIYSVVTWGVNDGGGAPYRTPDFATLVGDSATTEKLAVESRKIKGATTALWVSGAVLTGGSLIAFASMPDLSTPNPYDYGSDDYDAWKDDRAGVEEQWVSGFLTGTCLLTAGLTVGTVALIEPWLQRQRQQMVHTYYSPEEADHWIETYNAKLRGELGLSESAVQTIDLQTHRMPPVHVELAFAPTGAMIHGTF